MDKPILSWQIKQKNGEKFYTATDEYIGNYSRRSKIDYIIRIWNNRLGLEDVEDFENFCIKLAFQDKEDVSLLPYLTIKIDGLKLNLESYVDYSLLVFPHKVKLSGAKNDGSSENKDNYAEFELIFETPENVRLKESDLKSLYLEILPL